MKNFKYWNLVVLISLVLFALTDLYLIGPFQGKLAEWFGWKEWRTTIFAPWFDVMIPFVFWFIISWCNTLNPDQVGLRKYLGHLERESYFSALQRWIHRNEKETTKKPLTSDNGLFGTGLHFVPWLPGFELVKIPKKMFRLLYEKDPNATTGSVMSGTMFGVRSKDKQKLFVEATFFLRFPYNDTESLVEIIESGVPFENDEVLRDWIEDAIAPDVLYVFGQKNYTEVMGGTANEALNKEVNERLRGDPLLPNDSLLERCGLFGEDPKDRTPGSGEAFLEIEDVHLSGPLGRSLELVETNRLEAEAAKSVADKNAEETAGRILKMVARMNGLPLDDVIEKDVNGKTVIDAATGKPVIITEGLNTKLAKNQKLRGMPADQGGFKEDFEYARDQVKRDRAGEQGELTDIRVGNTDGTPFKDTSTGNVFKGFNLGPVLSGLAAVFGKKANSGHSGKKPKNGGGGNSSNKDKPKRGEKPKDEDDDDDEADAT